MSVGEVATLIAHVRAGAPSEIATLSAHARDAPRAHTVRALFVEFEFIQAT